MTLTQAGEPVSSPLQYYASPGHITDPCEYSGLFQDLPTGIPALCRVVQGIQIHAYEAHRYGVKLSSARKREVDLRYVARMLARIYELDNRPLTVARPPPKRLVGTCRDFATMLCAALRQQGVPTRVRCGFAVYFGRPHTYIDHWVCEYWMAKDGRWVLVDPELDGVLCRAYQIAFDPCDVPNSEFLFAGQAWRLCRTGQVDSRCFGFRRYRGTGFVRSSLFKDFLSLNKVEALPWDHWWGMPTKRQLSREDNLYLDSLAAMTLGGNDTFAQLVATYESDPQLHGPVLARLKEKLEDPQPVSATKERVAGHQPRPTALLPTVSRSTKRQGQRRAHIGSRHFLFKGQPTVAGIAPDKIEIRGARQHNLKNIDVSIPRYKLVVLTGVSGSGKSSLAIDTIYAEAQRRFVESLSPFIRHFLDKVQKPKVDFIGGLSPAVAIKQKRISNNPRSTVGTVTEVFHYLRLLYSRIGTRHCLQCRYTIQPLSAWQIANHLLATLPPGTKFRLLAPIIRQRTGGHSEVIEQARKDGYTYARVDGQLTDLSYPIKLPELQKHPIELVVDEFQVPASDEGTWDAFSTQLASSVRRSLQLGNSVVIIDLLNDNEMKFSSGLICPNCGANFPELTSQCFSFNSPLGMCPECRGLGVKLEVDPELLIHDPRLSILDGALTWFGNLRKNKRTTWPLGPLDVIADHYGVDLNMPWQDLPPKFRNVILYGSGDERIRFPPQTGLEEWVRPVPGLIPEIARLFRETESESMSKKYGTYMRQHPCPACGGSRLNAEARAVTLQDKTIAEVSAMPIDEALTWVRELYESLNDELLEIADEILAELHDRLLFMINVGLHYLTLDRSAPSLAGGEGQRVRIASQLGSGLTGVLYVLDEPSIGLHARDQRNLVDTLVRLRDIGNTILVIEHDADTIRAADWVIDMGPGAGSLGGEIVAAGPPNVIAECPRSLTGRYLSGKTRVVAPGEDRRREPTNGWLVIAGARLHNLDDIMVRFPLGLLVCVTGVSGSGKSSLVAETLEPALARALNNAQATPGPYDWLEGLENLDKVINITQAPIGRTPRSNPATYTKVFDEIRKVFASTPEARRHGLGATYFSFNVRGGRCDACKGWGQRRIEMHFLADVWVDCSECNGSRYGPEALAIRYKGKNIDDVLDMDVGEALDFFEDHPRIVRILQTLNDVGLGYIKLGQSSTTLSGGEAQRVKLARELSRIATGRTIYILDEPTTGLHFADIQDLLDVLHRLADAGNTVIVVEHNMDVIKMADWIIDMGPDGGEAGGRILATGTPEEIAEVEESYTGEFLRKVLHSSSGENVA